MELAMREEQGGAAQSLQAVADMISQSLIHSLSRRFLDTPFGESQNLRMYPNVTKVGVPVFFRLEQVGAAPPGGATQPLVALQTSLSACHNPGRHALVFLIQSDGARNRIYLGVRPTGEDEAAQAGAHALMLQLAHFLKGAWPGTRLAPCDFGREIKPALTATLGDGEASAAAPSVVALTGVPTLKSADTHGYPQSLDRLLRGLRGQPFTYIVVAEPIREERVDYIISRSRKLLGEVHHLTRLSLNYTQTEGLTVSVGDTFGTTQTDSRTEGKSYSKTEHKSVLWQDIVRSAFPEKRFLDAILPERRMEHNAGYSHSRTIAEGGSRSRTDTAGVSNSLAQAMGREYINAHAQAAEEQIHAQIKRFERSNALGCWNVSAYFVTEDAQTGRHGAAQLRALLSGEHSAFEPLRAHDVSAIRRDLDLLSLAARNAAAAFQALPVRLTDTEGQRLKHPFGPSFESLSTPLNTEELSLLINLPRRESPGVPIVATADFSLNPSSLRESDADGPAAKIGYLLEGGEPTPIPVRLPLSSLRKHALLTGITGSGKSTTCRRLLEEVGVGGVPFLVIEPAKDEYITWAAQFNEGLDAADPRRIRLFMPGVSEKQNPALTPLRLNPLDVVWLQEEIPPPVLAHIDRFKSVLNASLPMQESLPILLEEALFDTYGRLGWLDEETLTDPQKPRPMLTDLLNCIGDTVRGKGYDKQITANLTAALQTRIGSLRRGWKRDLFDQPCSTPWAELFDRPAVINLSHLGDDADKAFTMAVLVQFLYEYRQAQHSVDGGSGSSLRHLTVVEEAHRILLKPEGGLAGFANTQGKVAEMFANALSEIRAYGEGMLVVDQVPARLIADAVKNTNLKIVHRLVAEDDREAMASAMTLNADQKAIINRLQPGQAILFGDLDDMASWVQITA